MFGIPPDRYVKVAAYKWQKPAALQREAPYAHKASGTAGNTTSVLCGRVKCSYAFGISRPSLGSCG